MDEWSFGNWEIDIVFFIPGTYDSLLFVSPNRVLALTCPHDYQTTKKGKEGARERKEVHSDLILKIQYVFKIFWSEHWLIMSQN